MKRRLVFGLAVVMVMVAFGGAVAEAATVLKAPTFVTAGDSTFWLVLHPFPADLSVSTQGAVTPESGPEGCVPGGDPGDPDADPPIPPTPACNAANTFLLLLLAINPVGSLFFDFDTSSQTSPGAVAPPEGCPPPVSGYSGNADAPGVSVALVLERVFQALDLCVGCVAYTQFTSGALPFIFLGGADACGL